MYLSIYLCMYLCNVCVYFSVYLSIYLSFYLSIHLSFNLSFFLNIYLSNYLSFHLSIFLSTSIYLRYLEAARALGRRPLRAGASTMIWITVLTLFRGKAASPIISTFKSITRSVGCISKLINQGKVQFESEIVLLKGSLCLECRNVLH